jgi:hypothetical protein
MRSDFLLEVGFAMTSQLAVHSAMTSSFGTGFANVMTEDAAVRLKGFAVGEALHGRERRGCGRCCPAENGPRRGDVGSWPVQATRSG